VNSSKLLMLNNFKYRAKANVNGTK
jgi:hypothetical protein